MHRVEWVAGCVPNPLSLPATQHPARPCARVDSLVDDRDALDQHIWYPVGSQLSELLAILSNREADRYFPERMKSETRSAIASVVAFVLARMQSGMMEASTTRSPSRPCTRPY